MLIDIQLDSQLQNAIPSSQVVYRLVGSKFGHSSHENYFGGRALICFTCGKTRIPLTFINTCIHNTSSERCMVPPQSGYLHLIGSHQFRIWAQSGHTKTIREKERERTRSPPHTHTQKFKDIRTSYADYLIQLEWHIYFE